MGTAALTIDLDAIAANWQALDRLSGPGTETAAVVKADAYGSGAGPVALRLLRAGARRFCIAVAEEGAALRRAVGPDPEILVFGGHMEGDAAAIEGLGLTPMLNSIDQLTRHLEALPGHAFGIQLDTGMNRLGLEAPDWEAAAPIVLAADPVLLMSHLACADEPDHPMNRSQLAEFRRLTEDTGVARSLAATGGILLGPDYHFELTRPGIGLYGAAPYDRGWRPHRLALPVVQTRALAPGETVGYGNAWTAPAGAVIATVAAGYADGIHRALVRDGALRLWAGEMPCPVVGRISMDLVTVDVTGLDAVPAALDLIGPHQTPDDLALLAGTIGYEVLTGFGTRYNRHYLEEGAE